MAIHGSKDLTTVHKCGLWDYITIVGGYPSITFFSPCDSGYLQATAGKSPRFSPGSEAPRRCIGLLVFLRCYQRDLFPTVATRGKWNSLKGGGNQGELQVEENSKLLGSRSTGDKANA